MADSDVLLEKKRMLSLLETVIVKQSKPKELSHNVPNKLDGLSTKNQTQAKVKPRNNAQLITKTHKAKEDQNHAIYTIDDDNDDQEQDESVIKNSKTSKTSNTKLNNNTLLQKRKNDKSLIEYSSNWNTFIKKTKLNDNTHAISTPPGVAISTASRILSILAPLPGAYKGLTPVIAIDCEMVLTAGNIHEIARCSIINYNGHVIFDKFIKPKGKIINYLTWVSGIRFKDIKDCLTFEDHKSEIFSILHDKKIVGHSLDNDFKALGYMHNDEKKLRDLKSFKPINDNKNILSLKKMSEKFLKINIQTSEHDSVEDARASMALYKMFEKEWESKIKHSKYSNVKHLVLQDVVQHNI